MSLAPSLASSLTSSLASPSLGGTDLPAPMHFGPFPITERESFPPPDDPAGCWTYVTLNAEIALSLPRSAALQALITSPRARVSVDGQWLWWALRRKYPGQTLSKLSGSDLIHHIAGHCEREGQRLLLLGSTPALNAGAVAALRRRWPGLTVAGFAPPNYEPDTASETEVEQAVLDAVRAWRADYVVLGLGAGKEHRLAWRLGPRLDGQVAGLLCFGGAIDMASGAVRRAPVWCQHIGLEGLFRVWQQPRRLGRLLRVLRVLPLIAAESRPLRENAGV